MSRWTVRSFSAAGAHQLVRMFASRFWFPHRIILLKKFESNALGKWCECGFSTDQPILESTVSSMKIN